ncbi:reverse transcriptase domain-containing protein [Tanacetum coccineum]
MTTPVEKRNASKFCEFHGEVGHTTDECMHLKRQIEEMLKTEKLSHLIKELKQSNGKDQAKAAKKGEISGKHKPLAILMVQPWQRVARQKITQTFSLESVISFPPLGKEDGTEGPMIIEAEKGGHCVHRMYVDGGSSLEIMYEHCFNRFKNQMIPATTPLVGFSVEIIWPLGQISLLAGQGKENPGNPIHSPQNAKIPNDMQNSHITEQQNYSTRMHNGLGTRVPQLDIYPVRHKKRGQAPERNNAIYKEVEKLVDAGIMKEVHYHSWLSNPVMVKKHDDSWRMCVDFNDLNKACPKDGYPLPKIDWKVESLCGYPFKCFLDAYKGYHKIKMAKEDEENTAFITSQGIFYYSKMSFGLKNVEATYQHLADKAFQKQIGRNLEVYVDDLVIKSRTEKEVIRDIEETFKTHREINMKLNPKKCAFGMREGTFLGYKVDADGLRLASLNRFLSKSAKESLTIFKTLKNFQWTAKSEMAFKQMKKLIAELPMLTAPKEKKELIMYLAAAKEAISAILIRKLLKWRFELEEHDIYYRPRTSVKGQILADFIVERPEDDPPDTPMEDKEELPDPWVLFIDRSSCIDGSGAGLIITNPEGMEFTYALRFRFNATNNEAKYEALIAGLRIAEQMGVKNLQANVDSRLIANQYLTEEILLEAKRKARAICRKAEGPGKVKFPIVAVDYFTKWIEAKPVATITGAQVKKFVWDNIVCIFGLPGEIISDNGKQFRDNPFKDLCEKLRIHQCFAFVKHPQANGLVERGNRSLGTKAMILVEIGMPTMRTAEVDMIKNDEALEFNLDLLEGRREHAAIQEAKNKAKMENTIMPGFEAQVSVQETSFTGTMKQAVRKMEASLDLNGKDHMKLRKHWAKGRTSLKTTTEMLFCGHRTFETLRNATCMKCKHLSHAR